MTPLIVILTLGLLVLVLLSLQESAGVSILLGFLMVVGVMVLSEMYKREGYKQGQVDALTGKVKYELVVNADSTKTWEEIK